VGGGGGMGGGWVVYGFVVGVEMPRLVGP